MKYKKLHINSVFLCLLFFSFISLIYFEIHIKFFYLTYILFSLFLIFTFINTCFLFILSKKEDKFFTLLPALNFYLLMILICIYYTSIDKVYHFDKLFFIYGLVSCLLLFLSYILLKKINFDKALYWLNLKIVKPFIVKIKSFKFEAIGKLKQNHSKKPASIEKNKFNKLIKQIYLFIEFFFFGILLLVLFFMLGNITEIFLRNSLRLLSTACISFFISGFIFSFFSKELYYSNLSYYLVFKILFSSTLFAICFATAYYIILFFGLETHLFFQVLIDSLPVINFYEVLLLICSVFFILIGANIKHLLFDRKAQ